MNFLELHQNEKARIDPGTEVGGLRSRVETKEICRDD